MTQDLVIWLASIGLFLLILILVFAGYQLILILRSINKITSRLEELSSVAHVYALGPVLKAFGFLKKYKTIRNIFSYVSDYVEKYNEKKK